MAWTLGIAVCVMVISLVLCQSGGYPRCRKIFLVFFIILWVLNIVALAAFGARSMDILNRF